MSMGYVGLIAVFILGLVILLPIWPWERTANAGDWRALYESVMRDQNSDALGGHIYAAERAVRLRQEEIRNESPDSAERRELARAATALIGVKAEKVRWFRSGLF